MTDAAPGHAPLMILVALVARCDACLRIGGPSQGADDMVALAKSLGKQVFVGYTDVPGRA